MSENETEKECNTTIFATFHCDHEDGYCTGTCKRAMTRKRTVFILKVVCVILLCSVSVAHFIYNTSHNRKTHFFPCRQYHNLIYNSALLKNESILNIFFEFCNITKFSEMSEKDFLSAWDEFLSLSFEQ